MPDFGCGAVSPGVVGLYIARSYRYPYHLPVLIRISIISKKRNRNHDTGSLLTSPQKQLPSAEGQSASHMTELIIYWGPHFLLVAWGV